MAVIYVELLYGLVDFVQQIGRGAQRDGEVVRSVIVQDGLTPYKKVGINRMDRIN